MYAIAVLIACGALMVIVDGLTSTYFDLAMTYRSRIRYVSVTELAAKVEHYYVENASFPPSIGALVVTPGFEDAKSMLDSWQGYGLSAVISDGSWQFQRAVLFSNDPTKGVSGAVYFWKNVCGTGSALDATTTSWCGPKTSRWFKRETREYVADDMTTQRVRLIRTLQRFANVFNQNSAFPSVDALSVPLTVGSIYSLASLVGYAGSAANCRGPFTYAGVALDCTDLYDQWGQNVGYQYEGSKYVLLVSETPIVTAAGNKVVVAAELDARSM